VDIENTQCNARGLEYSAKITKAVLKKLLELVEMSMMQVAISLKSLASCLVA
jgi:hypothetical protein